MQFGSYAAVAAIVVSPAVSLAGTVSFTTETDFRNATRAVLLDDDLSSLPSGQRATVQLSDAAFTLTADALLGSTFVQSPELFTDVGLLTTARNDNALRLTFSRPVTAFGGQFATEDERFNVLAGDLSFALSSGESVSFATSASSTSNSSEFFGFTSTTPFTSVVLDVGGTNDPTPIPLFVTSRGLIVAEVVPEPTAVLGGLGLLSLVGLRRRLST
jgi:hypothetical protein